MRNQDGSAFITVLIIGIIGIIINSIMFKSMSISIRRTADRRIDITLLNIAEAGNEHALATLKSGQISPIANSKIQVVENAGFNGGAYTVYCSTMSTMDTLWLFSDAT
jgi:type II secretory pathway component PulK